MQRERREEGRWRTWPVREASWRREEFPMVTPPVTLEAVPGIMNIFQAEEIAELRVGAFDLIATGPAMVGEEVTAPEVESDVDEGAESVGGLCEAIGRVVDMEIEDG